MFTARLGTAIALTLSLSLLHSAAIAEEDFEREILRLEQHLARLSNDNGQQNDLRAELQRLGQQIAALNAGPAMGQGSGYYQPNPATSAEMGFTYHHASTLAEGWQRGRAALIHAQGSYELNRAQSMVLFEQARSLWFDNKVKQIETLYRKLYLRQQHRDQQRARDLARSIAGKQMLAHREATYYRNQYRLEGNQLDRNTGAIEWPETLADHQFSGTRRKLDFLFRQRAKVAGYADTDPFANRILKLTEELKEELKQQVAALSPETYSDAQNFVRGLMYEVRYAESNPQVG